MLLEQTHDKLIAMKMFGMAAAIKERLERRDHQSLSKAEFLGLLVDDEWLYRENRKLTARLKVAKFKERAAERRSYGIAGRVRGQCRGTPADGGVLRHYHRGAGDRGADAISLLERFEKILLLLVGQAGKSNVVDDEHG